MFGLFDSLLSVVKKIFTTEGHGGFTGNTGESGTPLKGGPSKIGALLVAVLVYGRVFCDSKRAKR